MSHISNYPPLHLWYNELTLEYVVGNDKLYSSLQILKRLDIFISQKDMHVVTELKLCPGHNNNPFFCVDTYVTLQKLKSILSYSPILKEF